MLTGIFIHWPQYDTWYNNPATTHLAKNERNTHAGLEINLSVTVNHVIIHLQGYNVLF